MNIVLFLLSFTSCVRRIYELNVDWLIVWLTDWLTDWLNEWMNEWLTDWLTDWLIDWLIDLLIDLFIDLLIDWFIDLLIDWLNRHVSVTRMRFMNECFSVAGPAFRNFVYPNCWVACIISSAAYDLINSFILPILHRMNIWGLTYWSS